MMSKFLWSLGLLLLAFGVVKLALALIQRQKERANGER